MHIRFCCENYLIFLKYKLKSFKALDIHKMKYDILGNCHKTV